MSDIFRSTLEARKQNAGLEPAPVNLPTKEVPQTKFTRKIEDTPEAKARKAKALAAMLRKQDAPLP